VKFAVNVPNFGAFADPRFFGELAKAADEAGWDGLFVWDHILTTDSIPVADPWVLLAVAATATSRIRLGTMVTPLPRRRPWKVARETVTLDHLSGGRLILGVGIGDDWMGEFSSFDEPPSAVEHGEMLDEALEVLTGLWSGEALSFTGKHYRIDNARFLPKPVQQPRIPIFVAGQWPNRRPFRRAARWDGVVPIGRDGRLTPEDCRAVVEMVSRHRTIAEPFEVVVVRRWSGVRTNEQEAAVLAAAGATWLQFGFPESAPEHETIEAVQMGPPKGAE
jgi:alkanesulfonate monooxygenase SsuD/methylene tetrahydromethanopterin reductase-like flavin-dependent oxidoreductase (luciferase family)